MTNNIIHNNRKNDSKLCINIIHSNRKNDSKLCINRCHLMSLQKGRQNFSYNLSQNRLFCLYFIVNNHRLSDQKYVTRRKIAPM